MMWSRQFGIVFGVVAGVGMVAGLVEVFRRSRAGLLAVWAWTGLLPFCVLATWDATGYANYYMCEFVYAAGLLGVLWLCACFRRWPRWRPAIVVVALLSFIQLALGGLDVIGVGSGLERYCGIKTGWGNVRRDSGVKAAGWYVREYVPIEATVMTLHTRDGMEAPVAEYYTGRKVLADYDLRPEELAPLLGEVRDVADVVIADASNRGLVEALGEFECVCTLRNDGEAIRFIYARPALGLPELDAEVAEVNPQYDREYQPRHVPLALPAPQDFHGKLALYQEAVRRVQAAPPADARP